MKFNSYQMKHYKTAYESYLHIQEILRCESEYHDKSENFEAIMKVEFCIHKILCEIAFSDGEISNVSRQFIMSIGNYIDEQKNLYKNYRIFINELSYESYKRNEQCFYSDISLEVLMNYLSNTYFQIDGKSKCSMIVEDIKVICSSLISINDRYSPSESNKMKDIFSISGNVPTNNSDTQVDGFNGALAELNGLIGLEEVKKVVASQINKIRVDKIKKQKGLKIASTTMHMVFSGNPGTGKTTVASIIARIYKHLGVLSKGQIVEKRRENLISQYVGQTAILVEKAVREAKGGILFIDDAYSLIYNENSNDFAREAIDTLVPLMDNLRDDLLVILAGYPDKMNELMSLNEGLRSRFPSHNWIHFKDYNQDELQAIFMKMLNDNDYNISKTAEELLKSVWENHINNIEFGNGRGVRNIFDEVITNQINRVANISNPTIEELTTILECDIPKSQSINSTSKVKIGFV